MQSIQPSNHTLESTAAKHNSQLLSTARHNHQLPSVMPATIVTQSDKPQSSNYMGVHGSLPEQHTRVLQQPSLSVPNIQRKRNAQSQLRMENNLQAAPGTTPVWHTPAEFSVSNFSVTMVGIALPCDNVHCKLRKASRHIVEMSNKADTASRAVLHRHALYALCPGSPIHS